jgi:alkylation response protein AidB-like acyl-CoA dehydrogenase
VDLNETAEDRAYRARVRAWFERNQAGRQDTLEQKRAWHTQLFEAGFVGMSWPREYGGQDARPMEQAILADEMTRANAPGWINTLGIAFIGPTIIAHGNETQKQRYLRKILTAEELWVQLFSEPNAGSDLAGLRTSAVKQGDHYLVNGQKVWTSQGITGEFAILLARTDPSVPKHKGLSFFLIDMKLPGVEVRPLKQITGSSEFCEVFLTNVEMPADALLGEEGQGWEIAQTTLGFERGGGSLARYTRWKYNLNRLTEVCRELPRDGGSALDDPLVRQKLGRMNAELEVMRYAALRVLSLLEKGRRPGPESSVDKLFYSELDKRHQELAQEILGPYGQRTELPPELNLESFTNQGTPADWAYNFLWSRAGTIYSGSNEIQKNIIGERVLKLPREPRADRQSR